MKLVEATSEHGADLAKHLRRVDSVEILLAFGRTPGRVIQESLDSSIWAVAGLSDSGKVIGIVGLSGRALGRVRSPWLLGADELVAKPLEFMRMCRNTLPMMREEASLLVNYVWAGNTKTIQWLKHLGFTVEPPAPYGVYGADFCRFTMKGDL